MRDITYRSKQSQIKMSKSKAGRKKKFTEPSKSLRARVPESQHDILVDKINEHCKPFLNKDK